MAINPSSFDGRSLRHCMALQRFPLWKTSNFHVGCAPRAKSRCWIHRCSHLPVATCEKARGGQAFRTACSSFFIISASRRTGSIGGITARRKVPRSTMHRYYPEHEVRKRCPLAVLSHSTKSAPARSCSTNSSTVVAAISASRFALSFTTRATAPTQTR